MTSEGDLDIHRSFCFTRSSEHPLEEDGDFPSEMSLNSFKSYYIERQHYA